MSRLNRRLSEIRSERKKALVTYLVAGDPDAGSTVPLMHALVEGGADVIELGVPFTDPIADGPVIQAACERALGNGLRLADVFAIVKRFRETDAETPIVLMGYLNPLEAVGYETFAVHAGAAGVDGLLLVDLPPEEARQLQPVLASSDLELVGLISPTTQPERMARICQSISGFVYYVSLKGVTGGGGMDRSAMRERIQQIRGLTDRPIGIGFGINDAETAAELGTDADAVIIGSAIVKMIEAQGADAAAGLTKFVAGVRKALDAD